MSPRHRCFPPCLWTPFHSGFLWVAVQTVFEAIKISYFIVKVIARLEKQGLDETQWEGFCRGRHDSVVSKTRMKEAAKRMCCELGRRTGGPWKRNLAQNVSSLREGIGSGGPQ